MIIKVNEMQKQMQKQIHLGFSPLTGCIYAGHLIQCAIYETVSDKQDVTLDAIGAVVEHIINAGHSIKLKSKDGSVIDVRVEITSQDESEGDKNG